MNNNSPKCVKKSMSRCLFEVILAVQRKCQSNEEQIQAQLGLSEAEFHGLLVLAGAREMPGCEFARRMGLSPSRASRVLDRLVSEGYATRRADARDRRTIQVSLTAKGKQAKRRAADLMKACEDRICGNLDKAAIEQVRQVLELLESVL